MVCVFPVDLFKTVPALLMSATAFEEASGLGTQLSGAANPFTTKAILAEPPAELTRAEIQAPKPHPQRDGSEPTEVPVTEQSESIERGNKSPVAPIATRRN